MTTEKKLTDKILSQAYAILVDTCGVSVEYESAFIHAFLKEPPSREFSVRGALGHGGKFRPEKFSVDCYPEDETPKRLAMMVEANTRLAKLKASVE